MNDNLILYWFAILSAASFIGMWIDKRRAENDQRRLPERGLLRIMALGGAFGGLAASIILRHKTKKQPFHGTMLFLFILQVGALIWWFFFADPIVPAETIAALAGIARAA